jgi:hypothetical protein
LGQRWASIVVDSRPFSVISLCSARTRDISFNYSQP